MGDKSGNGSGPHSPGWPPDPFAAEINAARQGCPQALGRLLAPFRPYLLHVANRRVPRQMRAKIAPSSIVQVTLLQLSQNIGHFHGTSSEELKAWMRGVLLRNVTDANRRYVGTQKRDLRRETSLDGDSAAEALRVVDPLARNTCDALIAGEEAERLMAALAQLSPRQRQVIVWRSWFDWKWADVGQGLGCTEDAARQIWARAVLRLKNLLQQGADDDG